MFGDCCRTFLNSQEHQKIHKNWNVTLPPSKICGRANLEVRPPNFHLVNDLRGFLLGTCVVGGQAFTRHCNLFTWLFFSSSVHNKHHVAKSGVDQAYSRLGWETPICSLVDGTRDPESKKCSIILQHAVWISFRKCLQRDQTAMRHGTFNAAW